MKEQGMPGRFASAAMKNGFFFLSVISALLMSHTAHAGSWWEVNGQRVYVPNRAKHSMADALDAAKEKGSAPPSGGSPALSGGPNIACEAALCLMKYLNPQEDGGPACKPSQELYFGIKVIYPPRGFDEDLTQAARGLFLSFCPAGAGPDAGIIHAENAFLGWREEAPN